LHKPHIRYKNQTPRERTWTIHFISVMKFVKAAALIAVAVKLLTLFGRDVHEWATDFVTRHGIDAANRYVESGLEKLSGFGNTQIVTFSTVAFAYSGLLLTEGVGLWLQKRWAEYLTAIATSLFIPIELYELYERFTLVRIGILALNLFIVWYLVTRLKDEKKEEIATEGTERTEREKVRVKICGITNLADALHAVRSGADELGFNFYKESPRYIAPQDAANLIKQLQEPVIKIGVFVNSPTEKVAEIAALVGLDVIQLHGDEDAAYLAEIASLTDRAILKAIRFRPEMNPSEWLELDVHAILLDSYSEGYGGSGKQIDWLLLLKSIELFPAPVYLAGGLTPENVRDAIRVVRTYAVDVASGVESSPGKKDPEKVAAFIKAAKEAL
jgi:phosphoribosylanthranilate isomerase